MRNAAAHHSAATGHCWPEHAAHDHRWWLLSDHWSTARSHNLTWSRIALPAGVEASSLTVTTAGLLVGGRASSGGDHPVLFVVNASGTDRPVPLHPNSPYAKVADLVSLAARGSEVVALGAHMAEHTRTSDGPCGPDPEQGLDDDPQTFETFGGQSAGGLLDIVFTSEGAGNRRQLGCAGRRSGRGGLAAPRAPLGPPELDWHRARQHTAGPGRTARRHRRRGHDHLRLGDHL